MTFGQKMLGLVAYRQKARDRRDDLENRSCMNRQVFTKN